MFGGTDLISSTEQHKVSRLPRTTLPSTSRDRWSSWSDIRIRATMVISPAKLKLRWVLDFVFWVVQRTLSWSCFLLAILSFLCCNQGGQFRRDRNLLYWKILTNLSAPLYGNDAVVFPGDLPNHLPDWSNISHNQLNHKLIVVEYADHDPNAVFGSSEGQAALFDSFTSLDDNRGWRPYGYNDSRNSIVPYNPPQQENSPVDDGEESGSGKGGDLTSQNKTSGTSHLHGLAISSSLVIASLLGLTLLF